MAVPGEASGIEAQCLLCCLLIQDCTDPTSSLLDMVSISLADLLCSNEKWDGTEFTAVGGRTIQMFLCEYSVKESLPPKK